MTGQAWRAEAMALLRSRFRPLLAGRLEHELPRIAADAIDGDEARKYLDLLRTDAALRAGDRSLDIGSGLGAFVAIAREDGLGAIGLEPDPVDVDLARRRSAAVGGAFVRGVAEALPFGTGCFPLVTLFNTLEHVADPARAIREAARVCAPGGHVFILAPNYAFRLSEPHYHVAWLPTLPGPLSSFYLRLRGRDPSFLATIQPVTRAGALASAGAAGLRPVALTVEVDKWTAPERIQRRWLRIAVRALAAAGLTALARRAHARLPRQSIDMLFRKETVSAS